MLIRQTWKSSYTKFQTNRKDCRPCNICKQYILNKQYTSCKHNIAAHKYLYIKSNIKFHGTAHTETVVYILIIIIKNLKSLIIVTKGPFYLLINVIMRYETPAHKYIYKKLDEVAKFVINWDCEFSTNTIHFLLNISKTK